MTSSRPPRSWWPDAALLAGFVALTLALWAGWFLGLDVAVLHWVDAHRPPPLDRLAGWGNHLGQGGVLTGVAAVLALGLAGWRRSVRPVLPVVAAFASTFASLTVVKDLTRRPAPHAAIAHPERFGLGGVSYPSGHLVNSIVWYGVLVLLLVPWLSPGVRRVVRVVPPVVLSVTTVYLGFHWVTDTVAGILLGLLLDRLMRRIPWRLPAG
ncbi:MAG: phosphatase PAP2 family protein [Actinobacteria bacterium]|nr:MAG: phosphatase PAP2 family protein [Actinomycetota bacterium]